MKNYSGCATEASERLRAQPAILHYKGPHNLDLRPQPWARNKSVWCPGKNCLKKEEVVAPCLDIPESPNIQSVRNQARTQEKRRAFTQPDPRQLKPFLRGLRPQQAPAKRSTALQSCCRSGSVLPKGSSEPPTHTPDIDLHYCQSSCNPGKGTRCSTGSVAASGTMQHR